MESEIDISWFAPIWESDFGASFAAFKRAFPAQGYKSLHSSQASPLSCRIEPFSSYLTLSLLFCPHFIAPMSISPRSALSPKSSNTTSLPGTKSLYPFRSSPLKHSCADSSLIREQPFIVKRPKLSFNIFQDEQQVARYHPVSGPAHSNRQNHGDQENILQPKKGSGALADPRVNGNRTPLLELVASDFPGYVHRASGNSREKPMQLLEPFRPSNLKNAFGSLHKHSSIPHDLTPVKRGAAYMVSSSNAVFAEKISAPISPDTLSDSESEEDVDDAESTLRRKHASKNSTNVSPVRRHHRSMLVGTNDSKLPLITRNGFSILSN